MRAHRALAKRPSVIMRMMFRNLGILTRTIRHRHSRAGRKTASVRLNLRGDLTLSWLIFGEWNLSKLHRLRSSEHLVGVAVHLHVAPDPCDHAALINQNRCTKNSEERLAIHGF